MADADDLIISVSTDTRAILRGLKKLEASIGESTGNAQKKFDRLGAGIERSMGQSLKRTEALTSRLGAVAGRTATQLAGAFAAGISLQAAGKLVDAATAITNSLKVAGLQGVALTEVYDALYESANRNAAPIESLVTLYGRLSLTSKELGVTQAELLQFSDKIALALRVGGTSAESASGALLQLSQALGGGVVRAEEFNSVLEGAPTIAQAAAAGLAEAGGSVAKLRTLVVDGKVSSEAFFRAFLVGSETLESKVAGAALTTSQRFVQLSNVLVDTAGKIDTATGASGKFGEAIEDLGTTIQQFGEIVVAASDSELGRFVGWLAEGVDKAAEFRKVMGGIPGILEKMSKLNSDLFNGRPLGSSLEADRIQGRIDGAFEGPARTPFPAADVTKGGRLPPLDPARTVKTVSIADYPIAGDAEAKGEKPAKAAAPDDFARELASLKDRTASLNAAYAAQAALNPLVDDYGYSVDKAATAHELLAAAQRDGKAVTPELTAQIDAAAEAYARATSAAEKLAEQQQAARDSAKEMEESISGIFSSATKALISGKSFGRALADALIGGSFSLRIEEFSH
ncbi:tape measure protein [Ensifer soli]|uniref:tape measure protein n=1 Tax=Ciceribacter sp. sgz301302 TaxID=3342379 RepID=UPI0035B9BA2C